MMLSHIKLQQIYRMHEDKKERLYLRRVLDVDHGTFTPLVFATAGGMGDKCLACQNNNLICPIKICLQLCQAKNRDEFRVETVKGVSDPQGLLNFFLEKCVGKIYISLKIHFTLMNFIVF